jgi:hypothetical protein
LAAVASGFASGVAALAAGATGDQAIAEGGTSTSPAARCRRHSGNR